MDFDTAVLDVDGTLVDSSYQHTIAWDRAFRTYDTAVETWRIHRAVGMGGDRLVAHVAGDEVEDRYGDQIREAWKNEADALMGEVIPFVGAQPLLAALRERGLTIVLATSGKPDHTEYSLDLLDARPRIDHLVTSEDVDTTKPSPDLLTTACATAGAVRPFVLGDSVWDARAAVRAGMPMFGVLTGGFGREELEQAGANHVYDDLSALVADLDRALTFRTRPAAVRS